MLISWLTALARRRASTGSRFHELFPVQAAVWQHSAGGLSTAHDLAVAAPTGSGKTLAYALPVVNALAERDGASRQRRLRALVVLPTRDLAAQVHDVFRPLCEAVGLRVALVAARTSEAAEAAALVGTSAAAASHGAGGPRVGGGGAGGADVVIATPGRLVAHLGGTPGFTLRHLRFLVGGCAERTGQVEGREGLESIPTLCWTMPRVVKIIVSATLTRDPAKLQRLAMHNPRFVATVAGGPGGSATGAAAAGGGPTRYSLPRSLSEYRLLCSAARKPLALLALLSEAAGQSIIVFTSSLDMTHKLYLMLRAVPELPEVVVEYSSLVPARERAANLEKFRSGEAKVLVASDAMTRGMDVDNVQTVINYDAPVYAKTYVHRAGRTARAGKSGRVITLLRDEDMRHFKAMIRKADNNFVHELKLPGEQVEAFRPALAGALAQLEELLAAERAADAAAAAVAPPPVPAGRRQAGKRHGAEGQEEGLTGSGRREVVPGQEGREGRKGSAPRAREREGQLRAGGAEVGEATGAGWGGEPAAARGGSGPGRGPQRPEPEGGPPTRADDKEEEEAGKRKRKLVAKAEADAVDSAGEAAQLGLGAAEKAVMQGNNGLLDKWSDGRAGVWLWAGTC
ncbi:hypothetical protein GPECTOR_1g199 [Gonium pectorale]|uniref:ATP-dependent RNA helicase n=1 Tax=Gonium pectorale TaxID=33097 RepID=A0A150H315_GONPE|nr:hypothetical protein GPECTOR_1g199 [Gonium pectorale]|eukprot:KXZ56228.1 hypothetical protein GPECTOR_1g199 [Gonium pectorale]